MKLTDAQRKVRLNAEMREHILDGIINDVYTERANDIVERYAVIIEKVRAKINGEHQETMDSLPRDCVQTSHCVYLTIAGESRGQFCFPALSEDGVKQVNPLRLGNFGGYGFINEHRPLRGGRTSSSLAINRDDPLCDELTEIIDAVHEYATEVIRRGEEIKAVLQKTKTIKQLEEAWPEALVYLPKLDGRVVSTAIALPVNELNKALGLPTDTKGASSDVAMAC